jgi:predicted  nucleic acid-binding Zn-ribbon protein
MKELTNVSNPKQQLIKREQDFIQYKKKELLENILNMTSSIELNIRTINGKIMQIEQELTRYKEKLKHLQEIQTNIQTIKSTAEQMNIDDPEIDQTIKQLRRTVFSIPNI